MDSKAILGKAGGLPRLYGAQPVGAHQGARLQLHGEGPDRAPEEALRRGRHGGSPHRRPREPPRAASGKGKKVLVFDAHIDTVGVGDPSQWKTPPHSGLIKDGLVHGRGASDQLGGAASMITAARILKEAAYAGDYTIWFAFTVIEEDCDGLCWKHLIEEEGFKLDFAVSTEPTSCRLYRGHRGRMEIRIDIKGVSCHGSAPERGESAAYKAARAALALEVAQRAAQGRRRRLPRQGHDRRVADQGPRPLAVRGARPGHALLRPAPHLGRGRQARHRPGREGPRRRRAWTSSR